MYNIKYPSIFHLKQRAKQMIPSFAFDYIDGGVDYEKCKLRNRTAFDDVVLTPKYLCDVSEVDTSTTVFGKRYSLPIGVAPFGLGNMMWPDSELSMAHAAEVANIPYISSTYSTTLLEEIAARAPNVCWFQLYIPKNINILENLILRVKNAGFNALVVTVDIPTSAKRNRELVNKFHLPFRLTKEFLIEVAKHPKWAIETMKNGRPDFVNITPYNGKENISWSNYISNFMVDGVTMEHLAIVRRLWDGPLIIKGVQSSQNVIDAISLGANGVIISNHGGRQIDAAPSSLSSLQMIMEKVDNANMAIMLDSGIRTGLDVVKAKASGARMTFSGRSFCWGLAAMGKLGATQVIEIYRDEITRSLKQLGCCDVEAINASWIFQR